MYLADRTAMELSDIFHGSLVTLARRLGIFEATYGIGPDEGGKLVPIEHEQAKR